VFEWDRLKIGSPLKESRLKSLSRLNGMVNPRKRIICKRFLVFEKEYPLKAALPNLGGLRKARHFIAHAKKCDHKNKLLDYHPGRAKHSTATIAVTNGSYKTICIDPPWPIEKVERTERPLQAAIDTSLD
jgi:hypothetical protein